MAKYTIKSNAMKKKHKKRNSDSDASYTKETVEEYLARGGKITICPAYRDPNRYHGDKPRPLLNTKGWYDV